MSATVEVEAIATGENAAHPAPAKTHLATAPGIVAARHGHRVLFATATDWVTRLTDAHRQGNRRRYGLIIVDEVGYPRSNKAPRICSSSSSRPATNTPH